MIDGDFLTTYKVFLLTLFLPIALIFFYAFLTKLPRPGAPIHRESEKGVFSETWLPVNRGLES